MLQNLMFKEIELLKLTNSAAPLMQSKVFPTCALQEMLPVNEPQESFHCESAGRSDGLLVTDCYHYFLIGTGLKYVLLLLCTLSSGKTLVPCLHHKIIIN